jgi:hypothetical protein
MDKLSSALKCVNCRNVLESPVFLPCTHSICKKHTINAKSPILCRTCRIEHPLPENGDFPINSALADILDAQLSKLDLGKGQKEAKCACQMLRNVLAKVDTLLKDPTSYTRNKIDDLKDKVRAKGDAAKARIDEKVEHLICRLNEYQNNCHLALGTKEYVAKVEKFQVEKEITREHMKEWMDTLNQIRVNDAVWERIKCESEEAIKHFESKLYKFKNELLFNRLVEFQDEVDKDFEKIELGSSFDL